MSNNEPQEQFVSEDELRELLDRWQVPEPSRSLDKRVASSYLRQISATIAPGNSILLPQGNYEVVTMKFCSTCQDEFADKFSFCPVDGTPLSPVVAQHEESVITAIPDNGAADPTNEPEPMFRGEPAFAGAAASSAVVPRGEYHLTIMDDVGLARRLAHELKDVAHQYELTWPEFKRDPIGFIKRSAQGYGQMAGRVFANRNVTIALLGAVLAMVALVGGVTLMDRTQSPWAPRLALAIFAVAAVCALIGILATWLGAQSSDAKPAVAGIVAAFGVFLVLVGGILLLGLIPRGNAQSESRDNDPQADLRIPQVVAPDPHPPVIKNPVLPVAASLDADPKLFPPDPRNLPYGDPKSKSKDTSSGPGTGNGIGTGTGGGVGPGQGGGYGPGRGGNTGGGDRNEGGGGPGGGGGGTDYNRVFNGRDVTQKARVLEKPEPTYTESARKNQITGTVVLSVIFTSGGQVTQIRAIKELPDGLTEKAIAAARQIRFIPAMKDGHAVSMYMHLEYNFNLY